MFRHVIYCFLPYSCEEAIFTTRVLLTIEFGLTILRESRDVTHVFICAKIDCSGNIFKVTVTSFKSVIACHISALNPVMLILMCISVEILSENRLHRRSCVTKVRLTALSNGRMTEGKEQTRRKQNLKLISKLRCT